MVLISALALPMGAKIAGADDHAAADPSAAPPPPAAPAQIGPIASGPPASALADEARQPASATPATPVTPATPAGASPEPRTVGHGQSVAQELKQQLDAAGDVARLEAELAAARGNVERLSRQLEAARNKARANKPRHTQASLGYMNFTYDQRGAAGGAILAFDGRNGNLMWKLDVPLNSESVIRCYDNDTLLIKSADGYTRLVTAADGTLIRAWAPGVEAPPAKPEHGVNPFGISAPPANTVRPSPAQSSGLPPRDWQDAEKRMDRLEESVRALTEAVDRLAREQKEQRASPGRAAP